MDIKTQTLISRHADSLIRLKYFMHFVGPNHICYLDEIKIETALRNQLQSRFQQMQLDGPVLKKIRDLYLALLKMRINIYNFTLLNVRPTPAPLDYDLSNVLGKTKQDIWIKI